jgi:5'-deoxynucleotidase YfbR-like HD superfamily hydrolase
MTAMEIVEHDALDSSPPVKEEKQAPIITPTQGAMDSIPEDEQNYLRELAMELIAICENEEPRAAWVKLEKENLDSEQKVALWTLLPSKVRSALKNAKG